MFIPERFKYYNFIFNKSDFLLKLEREKKEREEKEMQKNVDLIITQMILIILFTYLWPEAYLFLLNILLSYVIRR